MEHKIQAKRAKHQLTTDDIGNGQHSDDRPQVDEKGSGRKRSDVTIQPNESNEPVKKIRRIQQESESNDAGSSSSKMQLRSMDVQKQLRSRDVQKQLPSEMLEAVLSFLDTKDLLSSRQVNCRWNELSSRVLRIRDDKTLSFRFENGHYLKNIKFYDCGNMGHLYENNCFQVERTISKTLKEFVDCLKNSTYFPWTHFDFADLQHFGSKEMKNFLSIWGENIVSLKISLVDPTKSVEFLRKLLLIQVPNLKKLEILFGSKEVVSYIQLFSNDSKKPELPNLEVLVVNSYYRKFRGIIENILGAAHNLRKFACNDVVHCSITTDDLNMLQSFNKLGCLKKLEINLSEELITYLDQNLKNMDLKPDSMSLSFGSILRDEKFKAEATSVINQLLESSCKHLNELAIEEFELMSGAVFPKLEKLRKLDLCPYWLRCIGFMDDITMFPPLLEIADVFPNLKNLGMHIPATYGFRPQSQLLTLMQSIEALRMYQPMPLESLQKLPKMAPNVTDLFITQESFRGDGKDILNGFQAILKNYPKLTSFGWKIIANTHRELMFSLDAAMTGLPEKYCEKLSKEFLKNDRLTAKQLAAIELQRKHASILDLKGKRVFVNTKSISKLNRTVRLDLKQFDINFIFDEEMEMDREVCDSDCEYCGECEDATDEAGYAPDCIYHKSGFTKVSQLLAFQLMPHLKIRIHRLLD